jgi:hypothetical protein
MNFPSQEQVERIRAQYPAGTRVELISMEDPYSKLKAGDRATIEGVDDAGDLLCKWDSGSTLKLIPSADQFRKIADGISPSEKCSRCKNNGYMPFCMACEEYYDPAYPFKSRCNSFEER